MELLEEAEAAASELLPPQQNGSAKRIEHGDDNTSISYKQEFHGRLRISDLRVEPLLFFVMIAATISDPVLQDVLLERSCTALKYPTENCSHLDSPAEREVELQVEPYEALLLMYKSMVETPSPAIMALFLGSWSDKYGRRPIILVSLSGFCIQYAILIGFAWLNFSPYYVLVASVPIVATGGNMLLFLGTFSYITDSSTGKLCTYRMALAESMVYLGTLLGTFLSPYVYDASPSHGMFSLSLVCCSISLLYAVFFIPESVRRPKIRTSSMIRALFDFSHVRDVFRTCFSPKSGYKRSIFLFLVMSIALNSMLTEGLSSVVYLYTRRKFLWTMEDFILYTDAALAMMFCGVIVGTIAATKWLTPSDQPLVASFAFLLKGFAYIVAAVGPMSWCMFLSSTIEALGSVLGPVCRAVLVNCVESEDIGKAFVFVAFVTSLIPLVASAIYSTLYISTLNEFPAAIFILATVVAAMGYLLMGFVAHLLRVDTIEAKTELRKSELRSILIRETAI